MQQTNYPYGHPIPSAATHPNMAQAQPCGPTGPSASPHAPGPSASPHAPGPSASPHAPGPSASPHAPGPSPSQHAPGAGPSVQGPSASGHSCSQPSSTQHAQAPKSHACTCDGSAAGAQPQAPGMPADGKHLYNTPYSPQYYGPDGQYYRYDPNGMAPAPYSDTGIGSWFAFSNSSYLKGLLLGAGATLILTNSTVQKAMVRSAVKVWSFFQGGMEEVKEQFRDVQAEMSAED